MMRKRPARGIRSGNCADKLQLRQRNSGSTLWAAAIIWLVAGTAAAPVLAVEPFVDVAQRYLPAISPGTRVAERIEGWSHLLMIAEPTLADGDVEALDALATGMASRFNLTLAADVRRNGDGTFYLRSLGCGFAVKDGKNYVVVSADESPGVDLGFIERMVLQRNEACLKDVIQCARTLHMAVFDAKTFVLADGEHREWYVRHAVLVDPASGKVWQLLWFLAPQAGPDGQLQIPDSKVRVVPVGIVEKRAIHVDKRHFAIGFPTDQAFAMMELPKGKVINLPENLTPLFTARRLEASQVGELQAALQQLVSEAQ